jgi:hypothetical protein
VLDGGDEGRAVQGAGGASLDPVGLILAIGGALGIVWALIRANSVGWASPQITVTLAAGVLLTVGFVAWELRAADPMMPLSLFRSRAFAAGNVAAFCVFAVLLALVFFMAQFLQTGLGYGPLGAACSGWRSAPRSSPPTAATPHRSRSRAASARRWAPAPA